MIARTMRLRRPAAALVLLVTLLVIPAVARAHPLGDFTISRYSRLELGREQVDLIYIVDMAEIPTFQERQRADTDGDGTISTVEAQAYLARQVAQAQRNVSLTVDGAATPLDVVDSTIDYPPGNGGLPTTRMEMRFRAAVALNDSARSLSYVDNNFAERLGWREVVVQAGDGVTLLESTAPTEDVTDELRTYPEDTVLANNSADLRYEPAGLSGAGESVAVTAQRQESAFSIAGQEDRFAELINAQLSNPLTILIVVLAAFGWGAAHALTPGHGKTIVAAYLVGSRGTVGHALFLGLTTTVTHTLGVFAVGLITLFLSRFILPESLFPWLGVASGLLVVLIGWQLFRGRFAVARRPAEAPAVAAVASDAHDHSQVEYLEGEGFVHAHGGGPAHSHMPMTSASGISWGNLFALGVSGGLIPCPSALVLMLSAIALQRIGFGIVLIIIFSFGLAGVLTAIGIVWVKARDILERSTSRSGLLSRVPLQGRLWQMLPAASAAFITVVGVIITFQALLQTGLL